MWRNSSTPGAALRTFKIFIDWRKQALMRSKVKVRRICDFVRDSAARPSWKILFFGSDHFAVESLKTLMSSSGILNVHPSLLPRWRGPAPVVHTIMHGDIITGVTIMQIVPRRFDVGPILNQEVHEVPRDCTADELGRDLAIKGAHLLIETLKTLPERIEKKTEQSQTGATFAPKVNSSMGWLVWEEQTCDQIDCLYRAIGSRIPLRTTWKGTTVKLMDFVGKCNISSSDGRTVTPGAVSYQSNLNVLAVRCKDGWVGFRTVILKKRLTAADFHNGYLHWTLKKPNPTAEDLFVSKQSQEGKSAYLKDDNGMKT
ncbi:methionyl-tRNA formyltransferase, mitochondrial isoform X2 [Thalassophryne amazonica]|uniref:methionyl-tRNA formyltransferase, mitochondrial isoform X2 n=1 Tax=Thalassophryne amazonica TaxID=390379 RepID=UPI00147133FB|nr:methionyl-tRNA formyltransferase, mitochondrial isoform X2 [Thalassophryne amazonica]